MALDTGDDEFAFEALAGFFVRVEGHAHELSVFLCLCSLLPLSVFCLEVEFLLRTQVLPPSGHVVLGCEERRRGNGEVSCALCGACRACWLALVVCVCLVLLLLLVQIVFEDGVGEVIVLVLAPERDIALGE